MADDKQGVQETCEWVDEAAAYVLGEMSARQRERYGRHARSCAVCAEEVELLSTVEHAPDVMVGRPAPGPEELEGGAGGDSESFWGRCAPKMTQSRAIGAAGAAAGQTGATASNGKVLPPRSAAILAPYVQQLQAAGRIAGTAGGAAGPKPGRRRLITQPIPKPALGAFAGLLVIAALTVYMSHRATPPTFVRGTTAWSTAGIALQIQGSHAELLLDQLPAAPAGDRYEIWILPKTASSTTAASATRLVPANRPLKLNSKGQAGVQLPGDIYDDIAVGVYAEPPGTHPAPTLADHPVAVVYAPARPTTSSR